LPRITPAAACRRALGAAALAAAAAAASAAALEPPYDAVKRRARCDLEPDASLACRYRAGRDLEFELRRVGERDVELRLIRSSEAGDYRADGEMMSRCVFVRHGARGREQGGSEFSYAFVSGRNGFVYQSLRDCRLAR
jgi:hypothetical protein